LDWSHVLNFDDVDLNLAQMKQIQIKQRSGKWITSEIVDLIRKMDRNLARFRGTNLQDYDGYINWRNQARYQMDLGKIPTLYRHC
jgi:hypothetical protein